MVISKTDKFEEVVLTIILILAMALVVVQTGFLRGQPAPIEPIVTVPGVEVKEPGEEVKEDIGEDARESEPPRQIAEQAPSPLNRGQRREMVVQSTAYTHTGRQTASETWPQEGRTLATDVQTIPLGSRVYIKELGGWYLAEDKIPPESVEKGAKIDVFMDREGDCWRWGRRNITVIVEPPGPASGH